VDRQWVRQRLDAFRDRVALIADGVACTFADLGARVDRELGELSAAKVGGRVVILDGDYSEASIGRLLALYLRGAIVVPVRPGGAERLQEVAELTGAELVIGGSGPPRALPSRSQHPLIAQLRAGGEAGLILRSSGSTGKAKASLLSLDRLLEPHRLREQYSPLVTAAFLLFDHIGGIDVLIRTLLSGGTLVKLTSRDPDDVCRAVAEHRIELLPATPTFLNMLLIRRAHERADLSSLALIAYGTEVMPQRTLSALAEALPGVTLKQTYGMSELGVVATKSRANDSPWIKLGSQRAQTKVVDGILWVKSPTAMLGYLDAPSPFDADGWLCTGDVVDVDGEYFRVHGRKEQIINVAGQKVFPAEVESRLLEMPCVRDAVVWGKKSPVTGYIVAASVVKEPAVGADEARRQIFTHCSQHLDAFKVPRFIEFTEGELHSERFKKKGRSA
jgi:acyl-CoA synthetase (AMP-forming)/AMP-acid ligase II